MRTEPEDSDWFGPQTKRHLIALFLGILTVILFWESVGGLVQLSLHDERSSHITLIPLISAALIWLRRKAIFSTARYAPLVGIPLLVLGFSLRWMLNGPLHSLPGTGRLSLAATLMVLLWIAVFISCYGIKALQQAIFPMLFLVLMIPIPEVLIKHVVFALQKGSAEVSYLLFQAVGVPVVRRDFLFSLPGVDIEIAEQCSSIRSSMSLFIAGLLASHIFLRTTAKKVVLSLVCIPIAIFKNAVRIVTISWLGIYWNPDIFHGTLHEYGGLPFSLVGFALLGMLLFLLKRPLSYSK